MQSNTTFQIAVANTSDIKIGFCNGLQALKGNSRFITVSKPRLLEGSVDIDHCTKNLYPNDARWDYVVGYDGKTYFLEIHPANSSDIKEVIKKAQWLDNWLNSKATHLKSIAANNAYYWIASGKFNILKNSPQYRQLSQSKVSLLANCVLPIK